MLDFHQSDNPILEKRDRKNRLYKHAKIKGVLFFLSILLSWGIIIGLFYFEDDNEIRGITFKNNYHLTEEYLYKVSNINADQKVLFFSKQTLKETLEENPFIKEVNIKINKFNIIEVDVLEYKIVAYKNFNPAQVLLETGEFIEISEDLTYLINYLPLFEVIKVNQEHIDAIATGLATINNDVLSSIYKILPYETSYDDNMLELITLDNRHIYSSTLELNNLNNYFVTIDGVPSDHMCIYSAEGSNTLYSKVCEFDIEEKVTQNEEVNE